MEKYRQFAQMLKPVEEKDLILFDISIEEKAHIVKQYNRALINAQGDGTDVAQIFLKPLIEKYPSWGDTALVFGLCLAREGQFNRAAQSLEFAINNVLGSEANLTIAQNAIKAVRADAENPELRQSNAPRGSKRGAMVSNGDAVIGRNGMQAPILMKATKTSSFQMASDREKRDIMMRSAAVGDERNSDDINVETVKTPGEQMRFTVKVIAIIVGVLALASLIWFVIIPTVNKVRHANDIESRLEYIIGKLDENKDDAEVADILAQYAMTFDGIVVEPPATTTEETTEATTSMVPTDTPTPTPDVAMPVIGGDVTTEETTTEQTADTEETANNDEESPMEG